MTVTSSPRPSPIHAPSSKPLPQPRPTYRRLEWKTWLLILTVWGGWWSTVVFWQVMPRWVSTPLLIWFTAWFMSLQHELIHGHPTRWPWLNALIGAWPIAIWYPYRVYRDSHLAHHRNEHLTLPHADPESYYLSASTPKTYWARLIRWRNTSLGRLLIGPALSWLMTLQSAWHHRDQATLITWGMHAVGVASVLWVTHQFGISPWWYILAVAYPALSLTMVRSFYEHRAVSTVDERSVINEAAWPWRLLFLNLNYHLVHHLHPGLPWYQLRRQYLDHRQFYREQTGGFVENGYLHLLWRHRRLPVIADVHPFA